MTIAFVKGSIFDAKAEALVNPVNCVGVMGKGLALEFRNRFPENYSYYKATCQMKHMKIGQLLICDNLEYGNTNPIHRYIINFPTKVHWRENSDLLSISLGLDTLVYRVRNMNITSIAIPALGCGLGMLDWSDVKRIMIDKLTRLSDVDIQIYEPM
jgi:O-acetyl-ADP-ribose deacetylase (regulator of RNase III)